jgi:hypothetical protein
MKPQLMRICEMYLESPGLPQSTGKGGPSLLLGGRKKRVQQQKLSCHPGHGKPLSNPIWLDLFVGFGGGCAKKRKGKKSARMATLLGSF